MSALDQWVIYDHPKDYPGHFVARRWRIESGKALATGDIRIADTLDELREILPPGLVCLHRTPEDDPKIVEVWL